MREGSSLPIRYREGKEEKRTRFGLKSFKEKGGTGGGAATHGRPTAAVNVLGKAKFRMVREGVHARKKIRRRGDFVFSFCDSRVLLSSLESMDSDP